MLGGGGAVLGTANQANRGERPGTMGSALGSVDLGGGQRALSLEAGHLGTCAYLPGSAVQCWGLHGLGGGLGVRALDPGPGRQIETISAGYQHECARLDDGTLKCWGWNRYGQLGLGDTVDRYLQQPQLAPVPAVDLGGQRIVWLDAFLDNTCVVIEGGAVKCWGLLTGRGDQPGEMGADLPAVDLGPGFLATAVFLGHLHACALNQEGRLKCWGDNRNGQLGLGDRLPRSEPAAMGDNLPFVDVGVGRRVVEVHPGWMSTCVVLDDRSARCWGRGHSGIHGQGHGEDVGDEPGEMGDALAAIDLGENRRVVQMDHGTTHACALLDDETVKCWGWNYVGVAGYGNEETLGDDPGEMGDALPVVLLGQYRAVVAGGGHTCVLFDDGLLKCWGGNGSGQLGLGNTLHRGDQANEMGPGLAQPNLGTGRKVTEVVGGGSHTCVRFVDGNVACWGANNAGQLGLGHVQSIGDAAAEMGNALAFINLGTDRRATALFASGAHTCALLDEGSTKCWGRNATGQLGLGHTLSMGDGAGEMGDALPAVPLGADRTAVHLALGDNHTCAVLSDATVRCWGANTDGQLGLSDRATRGDQAGEMGDALAAVPLGAGLRPLKVVAGSAHTCVLFEDGQVKCWGDNAYGQLGLGDFADRGDELGEMGDALLAVNLGFERRAIDLQARGHRSCALLEDGGLKCWGRNNVGQLGLGNVLPWGDAAGEMGNNLPQVNLGLHRIPTSLTLGFEHTCVQLDDESVKCWGANTTGQLGLGDVLPRGDQAGEMGDALPTVFID
jgi:alpha-tubulin suppressor-like RCC1 family protein